MTESDIAREVFLRMDPEDIRVLRSHGKDDMVLYHHSVGRAIRNEFKLWEKAWTPHIVNGCDHSPYHPDNVSGRILEKIWEHATFGV